MTVGFSLQIGMIGPKRVTTGRPKAAATWRGPLSVETISRLRRMQALAVPRSIGSSAIELEPGLDRNRPATARAIWRSLGPHITKTSWSNSSTIRPSQSGKVLDRPELGTAKRPARIECDQPLTGPQTRAGQKPRPPIWSSSLDRGQFQLPRLGPAARHLGQSQIVIHHRRREPFAILPCRIYLAGQQGSPTVANVAQPLGYTGQPRHDRRPRRIGQDHGHLEPFGSHPPQDRQVADIRLPSAGLEEPLLIEPIGAGEQIGQIRPHDSHQSGLGAKMAPQGSQGGRGHHHIAQPIWKEYGNLHGAKRPGMFVPKRSAS